MNIKILGSGCKKCNKLYELVEESVKEIGVNADIEKITDFKDIVSYGVMKTPGLVIDGVVKASGRIPSKDEIKKLLG
ncbi:thioredoxin family protein [Maledivibacter halophilus]|uniref:Small redox-active disulfide protein 2 n=1 Tax=Maledivibacter halophilus TaxID=36842 RepID=A0A1T5M535_9FIRM|nr:thioredoxin family protein [Maledivibacter halophilus]SKC83336.1 small redox-active disulfide protein 2 [Maledivibacter halophilus]